jgi:hypothetical protein
MAKSEEEDKKPGEGGPPNETIFGKQERDPDEAVFAEQAIHHYAHWVLEQVGPKLEDAIESVSNWFLSQNESAMLNNNGLLEAEGKVILDEMANLFGGAKTPIAQAVIPEIAHQSDEAVRDGQAHSYFYEMRAALRDACWYIRDNLQGILSNHWDQLRDLAYEGNREFVPVIHKLGLPKIETDGKQLADRLVKEAEEFKKTVPKEKEEATKDEGEKKEGQEQAADEQAADKAKDVLEEEGKKQAVS